MGKITISNSTEPDTPESGKSVVFVDSTSKALNVKDDTGAVTEYGAAGGGNFFTTISVPNGTNPVADQAGDTLFITSNDDSVTITGNETNDSIDLSVDVGSSTLQQAYDASSNPEITVEDVAASALSIRDSATNINRDNILEVQDTTGSVTTGFTRLGQLINGVFSLVNQVAGSVAMTVKAAATQTANLVSFTDSTDTFLSGVKSDGTYIVKDGQNSTDPVIERSGDVGQYVAMYGSPSNQIYRWITDNQTMELTKNSLTVYNGNGQFRSGSRGSSSTAVFCYRADTNTGMYFPAADEVALIAGSTEVIKATTTQTEIPLPLKTAQYATASLPSAATFEGCIVYDTDTNQMKYSNGSTWVAM